MKRAALALAALLACSCHDKASSTRKAASFSGKPTAALGLRPEVASLVDALAVEKTKESSHIGPGGTPSAVFEKFSSVVAKATPAELGALLQHQSPVVRAYAGDHLARQAPAASLVGVASDETDVETLNGCILSHETVGAVVREALCYSEHPEAGAALLAVHDRGGSQAAEALACAAPFSPKIAGEIAIAALRRGGSSPADEAAHLRVLAVSAPAGTCDLARNAAAASDASVQIAAAMALGRCDDRASLARLAELAAGKNPVVALHAKASLFLASPARREDFARAREVLGEAGQRLGRRLQSREGAARDIALVEALALAYPDDMGTPFFRAVASPETTAAARRIAVKRPTAASSDWGNARTGVIRYLARIRDQESLPELRRSLGSANLGEVNDALEAVAAMHDTASRAAVEKLTTHPDANIASRAKSALKSL
jgi:hypothetical protein